MTDPYIPLERVMGLTRGALDLAYKYGFGMTLITKSADVLRDLDRIKALNKKTKCVVQMTITTYDDQLAKILEPNVSSTRERFEALRVLRDNGIPTILWLGPILPFINDTEENIHSIVNEAIACGVKGILCFAMGLTLRRGNREYFYENLQRHFPGMKERYIRKYANQYGLISPKNDILMKIFQSACIQANILYKAEEIFAYLRAFEEKGAKQLSFI